MGYSDTQTIANIFGLLFTVEASNEIFLRNHVQAFGLATLKSYWRAASCRFCPLGFRRFIALLCRLPE
jgi:hypothetical protein